jgi:hypothetical protein
MEGGDGKFGLRLGLRLKWLVGTVLVCLFVILCVIADADVDMSLCGDGPWQSRWYMDSGVGLGCRVSR